MTRGNPLTVTGVRRPLWDTRMDVVEREKKRESGGDAGGDTAHTKLFSIGSIFGDSRSASRRRRLVLFIVLQYRVKSDRAGGESKPPPRS